MSIAELIAKKWGPSLVQGSRFVIYQGRVTPMPAGWKEVNRYLTELKHMEKNAMGFCIAP